MIELLKSRRSIRKYLSQKVEKEKVDLLTTAALLAPSSKNAKPLDFVVVEDAGLIEKLGDLKPGAGFVKKAPLVIVVVADEEKTDVWAEDAAIAMTLLHVTATQLGLGSCWVHVRNRYHEKGGPAEEYVKKVLGIPQHLKVDALLAVGYPGETKPAYEEKELLTGKLHTNQY